jgi:aryl-alcohol dehydrogenase-like predicted oxidoreductase
MTYRPLGESGLMVSAVGVGCNAFGRRVDQAGVDAIVDAAQDVGITFLDTADVYGVEDGASETMLGHALRGRRDEFVVSTKFGFDMHGANGADRGARAARRYVRRAIEASLRRLQTDHVDLYQLHRPDPITPIEETLSVLDDLVREGKVLYAGCSQFAAWQVVDAAWTARTAGLTPFVSTQDWYSLLHRSPEEDLIPALQQHGVGLLPFFPLEHGLLTGKYRRGDAPPAGSHAAVSPETAARWLEKADWDRIEAIAAYAEARDLEMLDVAIGGLAAQPAVASVISGATRPEQVRRNAAALRWQPTAEDLAELDAL